MYSPKKNEKLTSAPKLQFKLLLGFLNGNKEQFSQFITKGFGLECHEGENFMHAIKRGKGFSGLGEQRVNFTSNNLSTKVQTKSRSTNLQAENQLNFNRKFAQVIEMKGATKKKQQQHLMKQRNLMLQGLNNPKQCQRVELCLMVVGRLIRTALCLFAIMMPQFVWSHCFAYRGMMAMCNLMSSCDCEQYWSGLDTKDDEDGADGELCNWCGFCFGDCSGCHCTFKSCVPTLMDSCFSCMIAYPFFKLLLKEIKNLCCEWYDCLMCLDTEWWWGISGYKTAKANTSSLYIEALHKQGIADGHAKRAVSSALGNRNESLVDKVMSAEAKRERQGANEYRYKTDTGPVKVISAGRDLQSTVALTRDDNKAVVLLSKEEQQEIDDAVKGKIKEEEEANLEDTNKPDKKNKKGKKKKKKKKEK